jgi:peptidoglycan/xylan/chitin deacetylase (PgdA/CDA1 family)
LLDADGVRELASAGLEIGSHSATHVPLAGLAPDELEAEVAGSRASLAALLGTEIRGFAYPYGSMDAAARGAVRDAGYAYACAVETPLRELGFLALPRIYAAKRDGAARMTAKRYLYRGYIGIKGRQG